MATPAFDFVRMVTAFEALTWSQDARTGGRLPDAAPFLAAMSEVALLFDQLGTGFGFVRKDITSKVAILRSHLAAAPDTYRSLQTGVTAEAAAGTAAVTSPPSAARTLLRLLWATKFLAVLMAELGSAYTPGSTKTLRDAVGKAYGAALRPHHSWVVAKGVAAALLLLPSKEVFLTKVGVDLARREELLRRVDAVFGPLVEDCYAFYERHQLLGLP
ncbi:hypothetical protein BU14_0617s0004 [Porphyra umbilicalis]|uniref:Glycolipid transfer protein domain-containing protein n=1 Tax=Porphyra umbilicalis TaxID=2786 RepID=A0A1X6NQU9_PORUM|nr:hypothetical protein BU14_0617s0004 [Porphyra umbilicalis]|eukprot:OSX70999.1 hypothetical protein BU14_0617s0004 [Porphyra umbilicalis]